MSRRKKKRDAMGVEIEESEMENLDAGEPELPVAWHAGDGEEPLKKDSEGPIKNLESQIQGLQQKIEALSTLEKTGELDYDQRISSLESSLSLLKEFSPADISRITKSLEDIRGFSTSLQNVEARLSRMEKRADERAAPAPGTPAAAPAQQAYGPFFIAPPREPSGLEFDLQTLLRIMVKHKASDLHIKPGARPVVRLDGDLIPVGNATLSAPDTYKLIFESMPEGVEQRFHQQGYADYALSLPEARFRVNAYREQLGVSAAIRMLRADIPSFEELNLPVVLRKFVQYNHGLILVTGPAGNGKSTTLASMINEINLTQKKHIVTVEDPVEFVHADRQSFITQREVGVDASSFFDALKQALRQDPNVILIGEMRDPETIWTAVMAAETGHLVLSTLHTPNTTQAIDRILDPFPDEQQRQFRRLLSRTLRGVVSQRLLPKKDGTGRVPAVEVMVVTSTIASLITEGNTSEIYQYIAQGEQEGMQTFTESLTKLYQAGLVTKEVALYHADSPTEFRLGLEGHLSGGLAMQLDWK